MSKRLVDGDSLWKSNKLLQVSKEFQAEYANLIPMANHRGVFQADARMVHSKVYSYNRPDKSVEWVGKMLDEFQRVKMLFRWEGKSGVLWGFFVNIDKPGRLPPESRKMRTVDKSSPEVPVDKLRAFLGEDYVEHERVIEQETDEQPVDSHRLANGHANGNHTLPERTRGLGVGFGLGLGEAKSKEPPLPPAGAGGHVSHWRVGNKMLTVNSGRKTRLMTTAERNALVGSGAEAMEEFFRGKGFAVVVSEAPAPQRPESPVKADVAKRVLARA